MKEIYKSGKSITDYLEDEEIDKYCNVSYRYATIHFLNTTSSEISFLNNKLSKKFQTNKKHIRRKPNQFPL